MLYLYTLMSSICIIVQYLHLDKIFVIIVILSNIFIMETLNHSIYSQLGIQIAHDDDPLQYCT